MAGMIRSGGAYIGFQAGMSPDALRGLLGIAHAMGLEAEVRGGGKRRHVVVHWTPRARVPRDGDERLERAIARRRASRTTAAAAAGGGCFREERDEFRPELRVGGRHAERRRRRRRNGRIRR